MRKTLTIFLMLLGLASTASALPPGFEVDSTGCFKIGGLKVGVTVYDKGWGRTYQDANTLKPIASYPVISEKVCEFQGEWRVAGYNQGFMIQEWLREVSSDTVKYSMTMRHPQGIQTNLISLGIELPTFTFAGQQIWLDDKPFELPRKAHSSGARKVKKIAISYQGRKIIITGDFEMQLRDHRAVNVPAFTLRLGFTPSAGTVRDARVDAKFSIVPAVMQPLSLSTVSNGKLSANDGKTFMHKHGLSTKDQKLNLGGIEFTSETVVKIAKGEQSSLDIQNADESRYLYIVHAADNANANPSIKVKFSDGSEQNLELKNGTDFAKTAPLKRLSNGAVVASNNDDFSGLYYSMFPLEKTGITNLTFTNASGNWHIVAATLSADKVPADNVYSIYYTDEGPDWMPMEKYARAKAGSALDFSGLLDAPAGKHGHIVINDQGHFVAEKMPQKRLRFFGPNLCFSANYLEKKEAEAMADEFARMGYTSIRLHHFDRDLSDKNAAASTTLDASQLDKIDYLFHCLKERGIYITIDLYCSRNLKPGEFPEYPDQKGRILKGFAPIYPPARENWKTYVTNLLGHINPYTGMTWAEDPTLVFVSLLNENFIYGAWKKEPLTTLYLAGYKKYLEERRIFTPKNFESRGKLFEQFLNSVHIDMIKEFSSFLRTKLNYRGLITDLNHRSFMAQNEIRDNLDFVDNHLYWDHPGSLPGRAWGMPRLFNQTSPLKYDIWCPRMMFPSRMFGRPFTVTEINFTYPNRYRAEFGPTVGAYAALQDWDGIYRFAWAHRREGAIHDMAIRQFDIAQDPLAQISDRIVNLLLVRNDVKAATGGVAWPYGKTYTDELNDKQRPSTITAPIDYQQLGYYTRVGSMREDRESPNVQRIKSKNDFRSELGEKENKFLKSKIRTSETGQIIYDTSAATFKVITPRTESLVIRKGELSGNVLALSNADSFNTVTASSMDGNALAESGKILLFHQTNLLCKYMRFTSSSMHALEHWGRNELLIRKAKVDVALKLSGTDYKVQALGLDGMPKADINAKMSGGKLSFTADTSLANGTMVYLIEKAE